MKNTDNKTTGKIAKKTGKTKQPRDLFEDLMALTKESIRLDPWSRKRGLYGYCEEIRAEADELMQAVKNEDHPNLKEELGDVLLDWCHACALAEEGSRFTTGEVITDVIKKVERRKPFLTENRKVSLAEARNLWKKAKEKEKAKEREPKKKNG